MSTPGGPYEDPTMAQGGPGMGYGPGYGPGPGWGPGPGYGYGGGWRGHGRGGWGMPHRPIETKPFFLTSEFAALVIGLAALVITTLVDDSIDAWRFWLLTVPLLGLYMLSRGIAKSGTRSRSFDLREELEIGRRDGGGGSGESAGSSSSSAVTKVGGRDR